MTQDIEKFRAGFEAWAVANGYRVKRREDPESVDDYFHYETGQRWLVWIASKREASTEPSSTSTSQDAADSNSPEFDGIRNSGAAPGDALDARRWRWLRDPRNTEGPSYVAVYGLHELDTIVDRAIATSTSKGPADAS